MRHAINVDGQAEQAGAIALTMGYARFHADVIVDLGRVEVYVQHANRVIFDRRVGWKTDQRTLEREVENDDFDRAVGEYQFGRRMEGNAGVLAALVGHGDLLAGLL